MKYISTRDKSLSISPTMAILKGISSDGGLFVPKNIPKIGSLKSLIDMDYKDLANTIMKEYFTDLNEKALKEVIEKAYDKKFTAKEIAPIKYSGGVYYLELFHGPTFAFKDIALSILPYLLKESKKVNNEEKEIVILTATSGDTGKAALENFANIKGIKILVFFPEKGVSKIQKLQMVTQKGDNTFVVGIKGDFDDAQSGVKKILNNDSFVEFLNDNGYMFSSANSINIGRLIPQVVYYFHSYLTLLRNGNIKDGDKINFVVPTGNFGNILAGYYAKEMGLPINKLICASNENNILTDFFNTGSYDKRRKLVLTSSPSMDILISSNLERLLFLLTGKDDVLIKRLMEDLKNEGHFEIDNLNLSDFNAYYSSEKDVGSIINDTFRNYNYLIDPHTAVGRSAYEKYKAETGDKTKTVIMSTASPYKFGKKVADSIGINTKKYDEFEILTKLEDLSNISVPKDILDLKDKKILHENKSNKEDLEKIIQKYLKVGIDI